MKTIRALTLPSMLDKLFEAGLISVGTHDTLMRQYNERGRPYTIYTLRWFSSVKVYRELIDDIYMYCVDYDTDGANGSSFSPPEAFSDSDPQQCNSIW